MQTLEQALNELKQLVESGRVKRPISLVEDPNMTDMYTFYPSNNHHVVFISKDMNKFIYDNPHEVAYLTKYDDGPKTGDIPANDHPRDELGNIDTVNT